MLSRDVIPLPQLTEYKKLWCLKNFYQTCICKKQLQSFTLVANSMKRQNQLKKKCLLFLRATLIIPQLLCHKQLVQKVTTEKSIVKPEALPPTHLVSPQFSNTFPDNTVEGGKHIPVTEWCWAVKSDKFILVLTDLEAATQCILK